MRRLNHHLLLLITLFSTLWIEALGQPDLQLEQGEIRQLLQEMEQEQLYRVTGEDGIGGTGAPAYRGEGGIGGTGIRASIDDEGIGGTGIIGEITGFGSIIVNGVHIDYDAEMVINSSLGATTASGLKIGQVVRVEAGQHGNRYRARSISLSHPVVGPVTARSSDGRSIQVLGQTVLLDGTRLEQREIRIGETLAVSGFWEGEQLHATQLEPAPEGLVALSGTVSQRQSQLYIGEVPLHITDSSITLPAAGEKRTLFGNLRAGSGISVTRSIALPAIPFDNRVEHLLIEGYVTPRLGGAEVDGVLLPPHATIPEEGRLRMRGDFTPDGEIEFRPLSSRQNSMIPKVEPGLLNTLRVDGAALKSELPRMGDPLSPPIMKHAPTTVDTFEAEVPIHKPMPLMGMDPLLGTHPTPLHLKRESGMPPPSAGAPGGPGRPM